MELAMIGGKLLEGGEERCEGAVFLFPLRKRDTLLKG